MAVPRHRSSGLLLVGVGISAALVVLGQLVLPLLGSRVHLDGVIDRSGSGTFGPNPDLPRRLAELWLGWGAVIASAALLVSVAVFLVARRAGWAAVAITWFASCWQVGTYLVVTETVSLAAETDVGLGVVASVLGAASMTGFMIWKALLDKQPETSASLHP